MEKTVTISDKSEYNYDDEYVYGRFYSGVYGGEDYRKDGRYIKVDDYWVKIGNGTTIKFDD